jgi:hypothetical protein
MHEVNSLMRFIGGSAASLKHRTVSHDGGSHRRCPSATQNVMPPAAVPPRGNADDERLDEVGQPPLPAITGGILCSSNGPPQNPQFKALPIKDETNTNYHKTKEARNRELIDERAYEAS